MMDYLQAITIFMTPIAIILLFILIAGWVLEDKPLKEKGKDVLNLIARISYEAITNRFIQILLVLYLFLEFGGEFLKSMMCSINSNWPYCG